MHFIKSLVILLWFFIWILTQTDRSLLVLFSATCRVASNLLITCNHISSWNKSILRLFKICARRLHLRERIDRYGCKCWRLQHTHQSLIEILRKMEFISVGIGVDKFAGITKIPIMKSKYILRYISRSMHDRNCLLKCRYSVWFTTNFYPNSMIFFIIAS